MELFEIIKIHLGLIVVTTLATTVIATIYTLFLATPMYASSTQMLVTQSSNENQIVSQSGALAKGGEIFVLDMGEPVKIAEHARQMIWLSGHTEDEIEIVESGIRPGEKLYEELLADDENTEEQIFEKIFVGKVHNLPIHQVNAFIHSLEDLTMDELKEALVQFANNTYEENQEAIEELETQGELA